MDQQHPDKPALHLTLFTDYICPFCYIGDLRLRHLEEFYQVLVNFRFIEIHPETPHTGASTRSLDYSEEQWGGMMDALLVMAGDEGIDLTPPSFIANSHAALLLAEAAKEAGREKFYALHRKIYEAYFLQGRDIGDSTVLKDLASDSGLSSTLVEKAWTDTGYEQTLRKNMAMAVQAGVTGTPTFFIGKQRLTGAVENAVLKQVADAAVLAKSE